MTIRAPFEPGRGTNQILTAGAAAQKTNISSNAKSVRLVNVGANICFVRIGTADSGSPATTQDLPLPPSPNPGAVIIVQKAAAEDTLSYISAAGTTLHVQTGEGGH